MAEFVTEDAPEQRRDTVGLVAGVLFAAIGLAYLIGGDHVLSDHSGVVLPAVLVLLGLAGLAGSGLVGSRSRPESVGLVQPEPDDEADPSEGEDQHPA
jgi:drug/metabolite transporter (DMT)-like permease